VKNIAEGVHERYVITCYELWVLLWGGGGRADHARLCVPCARARCSRAAQSEGGE